MNKGKISVIVPIYNVEKYLDKCINSIIKQTYENLEIILIDDGSTDNCSLVCENYKKIDNRIIVIHKKNGGLSSARNIGLQIATGEFFSFVDSDDYIEFDMLEKLKKNMEKYNSDISICDYYQINGKRKKRHNFKKNEKEFVSKDKEKYINISNEFDILTTVCWNKLYKRKAFKRVRYPEGKIFEDAYILCDILNNADKVSYLLEPLYNHVYRKDSIVHSFNIKHFDMLDTYNKKICFLKRKQYYDLVLREKNKEMNDLILFLAKLKSNNIKNYEIENMIFNELIEINKEVNWRISTKYNKLYKIFRKPLIRVLACMIKVRGYIKKSYYSFILFPKK